ncbi:MAG: hypothetical protein Q8876_00165 [Bacillota bacterium]|nr:hypothetical protein [Bacillota bacterium]
MNFKDVMNRFVLISGLDPVETSQWSPICKEAMDFIQRRLRNETILPEDVSRLNAAAAALSYYRYCLYQGGGAPENVKVGDVSMETSGLSVEAAEQIWQRAKADVADLLIDDVNFMFRRVI